MHKTVPGEKKTTWGGGEDGWIRAASAFIVIIFSIFPAAWADVARRGARVNTTAYSKQRRLFCRWPAEELRYYQSRLEWRADLRPGDIGEKQRQSRNKDTACRLLLRIGGMYTTCRLEWDWKNRIPLQAAMHDQYRLITEHWRDTEHPPNYQPSGSIIPTFTSHQTPLLPSLRVLKIVIVICSFQLWPKPLPNSATAVGARSWMLSTAVAMSVDEGFLLGLEQPERDGLGKQTEFVPLLRRVGRFC